MNLSSKNATAKRTSNDIGLLKSGIDRSPGGFNGMAINVNIDAIPTKRNRVLLFGDHRHKRAGTKYRILTIKPIFSSISRRKIIKQSIRPIIKIFQSLL